MSVHPPTPTSTEPADPGSVTTADTGPTIRKPSTPRRVAIVGALVVVATFAWGTAFYGLGFYLLRLNTIRGWSLASISTLISVFYLAAVALSFWIAKLLARHGPRPVIVMGAVSLATALVAMPRVERLDLLLVVFLVLSLGWSSTNTNPISTIILAWFPNGQRELSMALVGASLGGIVLIPALGAVDERFGFTVALTALGLLALVLVGTVGLVVIDAPPLGATSHRADRMAWFVVRGADFWVLASGIALAIVVQGGYLVHQLSVLSTTVSATDATRIVGVATAAALVGRFGPIVIGARIEPGVVGATYLALQTMALAGMAIVPYSALSLTLLNMLFGLGVGVLITMPSLLTRATYPDLPYTSVYPVVNLSFQLPLVVGAPLLAALHDRLDGYRSSMWALAVADLAAVVLLTVNHRRSRAGAS